MSERVTFTTTGATGTVLERFTREGLGDLSGEWASVRFDDGETIDVRVDQLSPGDDPSLARARYLGADAALTSVVDHCMMSAYEARAYLSPDADDRLTAYPEPELIEWAVACGESFGMMLGVERVTAAHVEAWKEGRDAVWSDALQATALRLLGDVARALEVERANEAYVDTLRVHAR